MSDLLRTIDRPADLHRVPRKLAIPRVETAFERHRHESWLALRLHSQAWMLEHRLMPSRIVHQQAEGLRYIDLVAGYYVGAPLPALEAISDFSVWFFVWDDVHGRCAIQRCDQAWRQLKQALALVLQDPHAYVDGADPLTAGLADCVLRFEAQLPGLWARRFALHFRAIIEGYDREYDERIAGRVPSVEEYVALRCLTFGYGVWLDCLELAAGRPLPPWIAAWDEYRRAGLACQEFSGWYNDLCSLPKELAAGEIHNLGISLIHHHGLSADEAIAELRHRIERRVEDFLLAEQQLLDRLAVAALPEDIDRAVRHCVFNMRNWIASVYWFHHESTRYRIDDWQDASQPPYVT